MGQQRENVEPATVPTEETLEPPVETGPDISTTTAGTETSTPVIPSVENPSESTTDKVVYSRVSGETVRDFVVCYACGKPRCLYSRYRLSVEQNRHLERCKEEVLYSCGATLPLDYILCEDATCGSHVSVHYYSNRLPTTFPRVCYNCGDSDIPVATEAGTAVDDPVCPACTHKCRTRKRAKTLKKR